MEFPEIQLDRSASLDAEARKLIVAFNLEGLMKQDSDAMEGEIATSIAVVKRLGYGQDRLFAEFVDYRQRDNDLPYIHIRAVTPEPYEFTNASINVMFDEEEGEIWNENAWTGAEHIYIEKASCEPPAEAEKQELMELAEDIMSGTDR